MCVDEKFLSNKPIYNLSSENDLFGNLEKSSFIVDFINNNIDYVRKNNMIALFGNWGSGKTTVVNDICSKIDKKFNPFIFNAWKYEKDGNLAYSLYEYLINEKVGLKEDRLEEAKKIGRSALKGFIKSINYIGNMYEEYIKDLEKEELDSLYKKVNEFEKIFNEIINNFCGENEKYLLVFIDELDRCDPENILNLLSSLKLLLTLGKQNNSEDNKSNIIYFCSVDKDAVKKAAKIRFGDNIKADEYLEKIFDISFNMPKSYDQKKFIKNLGIFSVEQSNAIISFFRYIHFDNPRHLKKIFNKYKLLCLIKKKSKEEYRKLIPSIIEKAGEGFVFDTIMVLYFIILHEFFYRSYLEIKNYNAKFENYFVHFRTDEGTRLQRVEIHNRINDYLRANRDFFKFSDLSNVNYLHGKDSSYKNFQKFISFFTPRIDDVNRNLSIMSIQGDFRYIEQFEYNNNEILIDFCKFIYNRIDNITLPENEIYPILEYNLFILFEMVEILL